jgi:RNA polymerase sigma factor (sigma-70 family)
MVDRKSGFVERLFAEHSRALQAYFRRRVRYAADAPDLVQEAYLRMLRVPDSDAIRNPQVYLYAVASNLLREHAIRNRREAAAVDLDEPGIQQRLGELPSLDGAAEERYLSPRLRRALDDLPVRWRAALIMQYRYGLTYDEIGAQLGVSSNMVKKYLAQALAHCRRDVTRSGS